ncbi:MAG: PfkB family carbohydrate kinase [Eubacteriales bacterium]|nr:PfkB family carbohydrate kinase [Eubacteriales bacterium]
MSDKQFDMIGFGNPFQDLVVELLKLPPTNVNTRIQSYCFQGGGNVPTATVAASVLGLKCAILGVAGSDMFGHASLGDFAYNGVDTSHLKLDDGKRTDFCICVTEREIHGKEFISQDGNYTPLKPEELDEKFLKSARILHIGDMLSPAKFQAAEWVREAGGKVSVDAAYYRPDLYENYRYLDLFIASEKYYNDFCKDKGSMTCEQAARYIRAQGPEIVIFTLGEKGCRGVYGDRYFELPAFTVDAVDSTGAGDVFHGAFNYAYLQGWDVPRCARFSSAVSAIKCLEFGGRAGIPNLDTVLHYLETGEIKREWLDERVRRYRQGFFDLVR